MDMHSFGCDPLPMAKRPGSTRKTELTASKGRAIFDPLPLPEWFKAAGVNARQVAEAIEVSESHLSLIASGKRPYMRHHLEGIADFLTQKSGREITPAMLLHPPGDPALSLVITKLTPDEQRRAAAMLEAFKRPN